MCKPESSHLKTPHMKQPYRSVQLQIAIPSDFFLSDKSEHIYYFFASLCTMYIHALVIGGIICLVLTKKSYCVSKDVAWQKSPPYQQNLTVVSSIMSQIFASLYSTIVPSLRLITLSLTASLLTYEAQLFIYMKDHYHKMYNSSDFSIGTCAKIGKLGASIDYAGAVTARCWRESSCPVKKHKRCGIAHSWVWSCSWGLEQQSLYILPLQTLM